MYATITKEPLSLQASLSSVDSDDILLVIDDHMKLEADHKDFGSYLKEIMERKKVSISDLSGMTGYAELTIERLIENINNYEEIDLLKRYIFCISIAMRIDYQEFEALSRRAGFRISDRSNWDFIVENAIHQSKYDQNCNTITINEVLLSKEMMPLLPNYAVRMLNAALFTEINDSTPTADDPA